MTLKEMNARWTKKNEEVHYGCKDHMTADTDHKFIRMGLVTPASVHDSSPYLSIIPQAANGAQSVYAESAYSSSEINTELLYRGFHLKICEKGYKGDPLTDEQKLNKHRKSKTRCRIEPICGDMTNRMKTQTIRTIGIARAEVKIAPNEPCLQYAAVPHHDASNRFNKSIFAGILRPAPPKNVKDGKIVKIDKDEIQ